MRPGPPPPPRPRRRPLGPTPRYQTIPRWGLADPVAPTSVAEPATARKFASPATARATLIGAVVVFALAAGVHIVRYLLLLINRTTLLPPFVAFGSLLAGVLISLAAVVAVIATTAVMASWLIARREAVFGRHGLGDPRPQWTLWVGCLIPPVNLIWAPVFVIELAHAERIHQRQRGPIAMWWIAWAISWAVSAWAVWTGFSAKEPQAIADNTVTMIVAYLAGVAVLLLLWRVFDGFERRPVDRPLHRWVVVPEAVREPQPVDEPGSDSGPHAAPVVESRDREPAA